MLTRILFIPVFCILISCSSPKYKYPHVEIQTAEGNIEIELYADKAPLSTAAFLRNIDSNYYENATFYRVLNKENQRSDAFKPELIQGGLWRTKRKRREGIKGTPHESTQQTGILHKAGVISFARLEPGTATTEFFICLSDQPGFDFGGENNADKQGYAAFGKVVKGMDVVIKISKQPEYDQYFDPPVWITDIKKL
jgi:peptidyl-prolyl cis-trans isomerase A (cyclophilin A)